MKMGTARPELKGATEWFNREVAESDLQNGKLTLIHFWSVSCGICTQNMGQISAWRDAHKENLNVVAVHLPRYEADTDLERVKAAVEKYNLTEPVAVDNKHLLKKVFQNDQGFVPAYYLFDADGKLKSFAAGERGLGILKAAFERTMSAKA
jgi:thiol-disulfide isomerase/thioredoxin